VSWYSSSIAITWEGWGGKTLAPTPTPTRRTHPYPYPAHLRDGVAAALEERREQLGAQRGHVGLPDLGLVARGLRLLGVRGGG